MLIERIAQGDQLAMRTLFGRHRVALYRWLLRLVRDEALAEDLLSDVFLDVWRTASQFEGRSQVSTWLLSIARFKALTSLRQRKFEDLDQEDVREIADEVVCAATPEPFSAVGLWYVDFSQTTDEEVRELLTIQNGDEVLNGARDA